MFCCCAKARKDNDDESISGYESKMKVSQLILLEFTKEESNLKLKDIPLFDIMNDIFAWNKDFQIPRKDLFELFKKYPKLNQLAVKNFLIQNYFYTDNTGQFFDFLKIICFALLYCGEREKEVEKS